jgi:hypothetical protein
MNQTFSALRFNQLANPQSNKVVRTLGAGFAISAPHHNVEAFMSEGQIGGIFSHLLTFRINEYR